MNEKELGRALLRYGALEPATAPPPDPRVLTQKILEQDKRAVESYVALTLAFSLLAAGATVYVIYVLVQGFNDAAQFMERSGTVHQILGFDNEGLVVVGCSTLAFLLLAILCTVQLVITTRRATLRQVNANLMEISQQLKQLQQTLATQAGRPPAGSALGN